MPEMIKSKKRVGLISSDKVGPKMAGPGIRYLELARALVKFFDVTLFVPYSTDLVEKNIKIIPFDPRPSSFDLMKKVVNLDVVIAQSLYPPLLYKLKKRGIKFIADLYDPLLIEVLECTKDDNYRWRQSIFDFIFCSLVLEISAANHILCASERQKDYYVGVLSGRKILTPKFHDASPNLENFITLAPFGLDHKPPKAKNPEAIFQKFPQIKKGDKILYWGGGIWNWFDPLSVIKAVEIISLKRKDVKLFFLGTKHPNSLIKKMKTANEAVHYAKDKGLLDKFVFFNFDWTPYEERADYLMQAAIGVSTHFDNTETRFSFRTRILDYLWAELPMILTRGDAFAKLCEEKNLGRVVDFENPKQIAAAAEAIIDNPTLTATIKKNIKEVKKDFYWTTIAGQIAAVIKDERWIERRIFLPRFLGLAFNFYLAGLLKKLSK